MDSREIRSDLERFQVMVQRLGGEVGRASALWGDEKYAELSAALRVIADNSKSVIVAGEQCCSSIDRFAQISAEQC